MEEPFDRLNALPVGVLETVFSFLDSPIELARVACTTRSFLFIISHLVLPIREQIANGKVLSLLSCQQSQRYWCQSRHAKGISSLLAGSSWRLLKGPSATDFRLAALAVGSLGCYAGLTELKIYHAAGLTDIGYFSVASCCQGLRSISLTRSACSDQAIASLARGCSLESVDLCSCPQIGDLGITALADGCCSSLLKFRLRSTELVSDAGLCAISKCSKLQSLTVGGCPSIGLKSIGHVLSSCNNLKVLWLSDCTGVGNEVLQIVGQHCTSLTELGLSELQGISELGFWALGNYRGCRSLRSLSVAECTGLTDEALASIGKGSPYLSKLCLSRCWEFSLAGLVAMGCSMLERIDVRDCASVSDTDLAALFRALPLQSLRVSECKYQAQVGSVPPVHCEWLRTLDLSCCPGLTDSTLSFLGVSCPFLTEVNMSFSKAITDGGVAGLVLRARALQKLDLSWCSQITDASAEAIARGCGPSLQRLQLNGCPSVSHSGFFTLAKTCRSLDVLKISWSGVTDASLQALLEANGSSLTALDITFCPAITPAVLPQLAACRNLCMLRMDNSAAQGSGPCVVSA